MGEKLQHIPLAMPDIRQADVAAVEAVLRSGRLALGPQTRAFEEALAAHAGVRHAVAVNSGTSALHLVIRGLEIGPGDEVITTPFSFVSSTNCILFERATPVFADIDPVTLCISPAAVERAITPNTKAILAVDVFGHPADWTALEELARKHDLRLVEDSAEALGSSLRGKPCGGFGDAGVFAFYPNKQITTGEGGAVLTDDETLAALARSMNDQGRGDGGWLNHVRLGYNYRIDEMSAALGCSQISRLDDVVSHLATVAGWYEEALADVADVQTPTVGEDVEMSWFVYVVRLARMFARGERDAVLRGLQQEGISCRDYFQPIHLQPYIRQMLGTRPGQFPVTESIADRTIALPFYAQLAKEDVERVADALHRLARRRAAW